ncbi:MAG: ETC complex I subunit [Dongiaceae bacterium]
MHARIYRPSKTATQSGEGNTHRWLLEFEPAEPRRADPLMGWTSSGDTRRQLRLFFDSEAEAVAYAKKNRLSYEIMSPQGRKVRPKAYADNFAYNRVGRWTH